MNLIRNRQLYRHFGEKRLLFQWINVIFNGVDTDRRKLVGPDRSCAEWLLRNGAYVKWNNATDFLIDYNKLPDETERVKIVEISAVDSSIMHYGFAHFEGCDRIKKITFHKCNYLYNEALKGLAPLGKSLSHLQISECYNISEKGLIHLTLLPNLHQLKLCNLPYVKQPEKIVKELQQALPRCNIQFS